MGNSQSSIQRINYEDIQFAITKTENHLIINTLGENEQDCLLPNTLSISRETSVINMLMSKGNTHVKIIVYGRNCNDEKIYAKYKQLVSLGFSDVYVYTGGLFEWLMLQDIFGENDFPTTKKEMDILKYKPSKTLNVHLLEYNHELLS
jgi:rhodanese-related sulfurtransferase